MGKTLLSMETSYAELYACFCWHISTYFNR